MIRTACIVATLALTGPAAAAFAGQPTSQTKTAAKGTAKSTAKSSPGVSVTPRSGREGTTVTIKYPSAVKGFPQAEQVLIEDPGVHGYYFAHDAGIYITYDGRRDSKYTVPATAVAGSTAKNAYRFTIPEGVCGVILQSTQATVTKVPAGAIQGSPTVVGQNVTKYPTKSSSGGKRLEVSIVGQKGKPATFSLTCDKYTVTVKVSGAPTDVTPLPGASTVSATVTAKGAVQAVVGAKVKTPPDTPNAIIPIGRITVMFTTDFGTMAPASPAKVVTGADGTGIVTISSGDPGTATAVAVAQGLGDGRATIEFTSPKKKKEPTPAFGRVSLGGSATGQCAAETQKRHRDIVAGLQGHPTHEIAQALVESDTKNPSVAECARKRGGGGGGAGDDTTPIMQNNGTGNPPLDDTTDAANKSADKTPTTPTTTDTGKTPPKDNPFPKKVVILGGAGAGAAAAILVAKGGGGGGGATGTGSGGTGGTGGGGGGGFNPTTLNSPPDYKNSVTLWQPSCQGSDSAYGESATVNLSSNGAGTITLTDTPNFQRVYQVNGVTALNQMITANGTFSFLGASVPGTLSVTFTSTTSMTFSEKTNWGTCSNTYMGTLAR